MAQFNLAYLMQSSAARQAAMVEYAQKDPLFETILHDLLDYGLDMRFGVLGRAGAYQPYALSTEPLDTPEKQAQFARGFWSMAEKGNVKAQMRFSVFAGQALNMHNFLHEMMHFYQDMYGLYFLPLQEKGVFPVSLDVRGDLIATLFCEAWAEVETIRATWAIAQKGDSTGWDGAVNQPDFGRLARQYDADLKAGTDEAKAAAQTFRRWYEGKKHRKFYEHHALTMHELNYERHRDGAPDVKRKERKAKLRTLRARDIVARIPEALRPVYFEQIDWRDELYNKPLSKSAKQRLDEIKSTHSWSKDRTISDIHCGAPAYIWKRLRNAEIMNAEHPPQQMMQRS